jgi:hypothetical protein
MAIRVFSDNLQHIETRSFYEIPQFSSDFRNDMLFNAWASLAGQHQNAYLVMKNGVPLIAGTFYYNCGSRMTMHWVNGFSHPAQADWPILNIACRLARAERCSVLQTELKKETLNNCNAAWTNGFYVSSICLIYPVPLAGLSKNFASCHNNFLKEVSLVNIENRQRLCELELQQRWQFPWLTLSDTDNFTKINEDYSSLGVSSESGAAICLAINGELAEGFILLLVNSIKKIVTIDYIFLPPDARGKGTARLLFLEAIARKDLFEYQFLWISSICNVASFSFALSMGFQSQKLFFQRDIN